MFLAGAQDDWTTAPSPWLLAVRDGVGLALAMVCAVLVVLFFYAVVP